MKKSKLKRRLAVLEYALAELHRQDNEILIAIGALGEHLRNHAESQHDVTATRRLLVVDAENRPIIQMTADADGQPVVQLIRRGVTGDITADESLST